MCSHCDKSMCCIELVNLRIMSIPSGDINDDVMGFGCCALCYMVFVFFEGCSPICFQRDLLPSLYFFKQSNNTSWNPVKGIYSVAHFLDPQKEINKTYKHTREAAPEWDFLVFSAICGPRILL
jgi:hypothetical protein